MGLLGLLGWAIYGGAAAHNRISNYNYENKKQQEALVKEQPYFFDKTGVMRLTNNPSVRVSYHMDDYRKGLEVVRRACLTDEHFRVVYVYPEYWDLRRNKGITKEEADEILGCDCNTLVWCKMYK